MDATLAKALNLSEEEWRDIDNRDRCRWAAGKALKENYDAIDLQTMNSKETEQMTRWLREFGWEGKIIISQEGKW